MWSLYRWVHSPLIMALTGSLLFFFALCVLCTMLFCRDYVLEFGRDPGFSARNGTPQSSAEDFQMHALKRRGGAYFPSCMVTWRSMPLYLSSRSCGASHDQRCKRVAKRIARSLPQKRQGEPRTRERTCSSISISCRNFGSGRAWRLRRC